MVTYQKLITVKPEHLDHLNHVNNVQYLEWVQQISAEHWEKQVAPSVQKKLIWVVRNHNITYHNSAVLGDILEVTTQVKTWKGPISIREVIMKNNKTRKLVVMATTEWCALHPVSQKPIRVPETVQQLFANKNE